MGLPRGCKVARLKELSPCAISWPIDTTNMFSWISIHREAIHRILEYRQNEKELLTILREMEQQGLKVISLQDEGADGQTIPLAEIDPFTFLASFNRRVTDKNRKENWSFLKARWGLKAPVPDDFTGIPVLHNMTSRLFPHAGEREKDHVGHLWHVAALASDGGIEKVDEESLNRCLKLKCVGIRRLTIVLFWINPEKFLPADHKTTAYGKANGITTEPENYQSYRQWLKWTLTEQGKQTVLDEQKAQAIAEKWAALHKQSAEEASDDDDAQSPEESKADNGDLRETSPESRPRHYWTFSPGEDAENWEEFHQKGIMAIGWDDTQDLRQFKSKDEVRQKLQELWPSDSSPTNNALACWQFVHGIKIGDIIFAKQGQTKLLGYGVVEGDYQFDPARAYYKHVRKMKWWAKGEWDMPEESKMALKTLTDVTPYPDFVKLIASKVGLEMGIEPTPVVVAPPASPRVAYWWLNANPKMWNLEEWAIGRKQTYTSHNEKGNKRQKYKYFQEVKPGDLVVGYVTSPQKEVVAVCKITRGLHQTEDGEGIEIQKAERLDKPIAYETLQANPDLASSEPINNNQGSLFQLTEQEYEIIRSLIDDSSVLAKVEIEPYDDQKAKEGLFLHPDQFNEVLNALKEKKNVVLQGAPGVGKTFIAERLAYAFIGFKDRQRVKMIQFHQSYSYEDFIQGFRPTAKGTFAMKYGIFHQFCRQAQRDEAQGKPYVFIIDEINRGNLSKIFGELMMLIEPDKRGNNYAIPLAYSENPDEEFYIPENLHLLGLMNTADRSLAMVDYALRRRFRFIPLQPEFASKAFAGFLAQKGASAELVHKIVSRMNELNKAIADDKNLGSGFQIGHSYFCPQDDIVPDENWYRRVVRTEIIPLIQEYWFDEPKKVEKQQYDLLA